jgi:hypothetical protein
LEHDEGEPAMLAKNEPGAWGNGSRRKKGRE